MNLKLYNLSSNPKDLDGMFHIILWHVVFPVYIIKFRGILLEITSLRREWDKRKDMSICPILYSLGIVLTCTVRF
jgi:hypothetical protein